MSRIGSWALSAFSRSQLNVQDAVSNKKDATVQTMLSASSTAHVSNEWMFNDGNNEAVDIDFIANGSENDEIPAKPLRIRRKRIPDKPNHQLSLWTMLKDLIGQNLTNVSLPININEPITVLQRLAETFESSYLLDLASDSENINDQIAYVAAFVISGYAVSAERTGKPFNPLLGETYEFDRSSDLGWKCIVEQVSHHPSVSALHCESEKWIFWEDLTADLYFRGKYIRVVPNDYRYVKFKSNQMTYRIERAETVIHNILFGKIWIDHCGKVEIICIDNDAVKCNLTFTPTSSFSRTNQRTVNGQVIQSSKVKRLIRGTWSSKIEIARNLPDESGELLASNASFVTVWERNPPKAECSKYYNFTEFACELNEPEPSVAPTDSRLRPDVRSMENGKWDEANDVKLRLEEKQRQMIRRQENVPIIPYRPIWFVKTTMPYGGVDQSIYIYNDGYWEAKRKGDWSMCPDIF